MGVFEESLENYTKAIELRSSYSKAYNDAGLLFI